MNSEDRQPLVWMRGICKYFPGVKALDHAELSVHQGEILGLVGKNGAGKTTLVNILTGILAPDAGRIRIGNQEYAKLTRREAIHAGIAMVPQQPRLIPHLSVAENLCCGQLPRDRLGFVRWKDVFQEAQRRLDLLGVPIDSRLAAESLRVAEQKMIEIARAIFADARVIILDEPTVALPRHDIDVLFSFVRTLRERGVSFIYISHRLQEVFDLCDRATVLRDGRTVGTFPVSEMDPTQLIRLMVGVDVGTYRRNSRLLSGKPVLVLRNVSQEGAFQDVSLDLRPGEVVGLTGLRGSGAQELGQALYGLSRWSSGEVLLDGQPMSPGCPRDALERGIAYIPEDRRREGVVGIRSVRENITLCVLRRLRRRGGFLAPRDEAELVSRYVKALEIVTPSIEQRVELLSGGNQQKTLFARCASLRPKVLILQEPTQGIDVRTKTEIYRLIDEISKEGVAVLIISTEIQELLDNCDRVLVFFRGQVKAEIRPQENQVTEEQVAWLVEGEGHAS
ncbi:MAG: sugar ABC transporter ATP-binding protein [Firmicutes bacterium]|nr:sugar ABC transporter ATP-binding protein [Bacillota bacterium]